MSDVCDLILRGYEVSLTPHRDDFSFGGGECRRTGSGPSILLIEGEEEELSGLGRGAAPGAGFAYYEGDGYGDGLARGSGYGESIAAGHELGSGYFINHAQKTAEYQWERPDV